MRKRLSNRKNESAPGSDGEESLELPRELDFPSRPPGTLLSHRESSEAEELQILVRTHRGGESSQTEQQSTDSGDRIQQHDRLLAATGQSPRGLALGVARRFDITQKLARDGIDIKYMEDVTRLAHDLFSTFFPPEIDNLQQPKVVPMTWQAVHFEHTFIAAAWLGAASRLLMTGSTSLLSQRELRIYNSAVTLLRQAILDPVLQTHDSTIQAILHLTFKPPPPSTEAPPPAPRQSVFHTWNVVNVTSGLNLTEEHLNGVKAVVSAKGGIQNIQTDHIRHLVSFQDLNYATRHLVRPSFPYVARDANNSVHNGSHLMGSPLQRHDFSSSMAPDSDILDDGFRRISWPQFAEVDTQPLQVWTYMADVVAILEQFISGDPACNPQLLIVDQVCFVQHCLMSLPPAAAVKASPVDQDPKASPSRILSLGGNVSDKQRQLYEVARLGCIAFSHLVTHPTSATSFPRLRLTKELLRALRSLQKDRSSLDSLETAEAQLAYWASVVGAIVALGLVTRMSLAIQVSTWARHPMVSVRDWLGAKQVVKRFLWHSDTIDADALELWIKIGGLWGGK